MTHIRRHPLISFFVSAYAFTWLAFFLSRWPQTPDSVRTALDYAAKFGPSLGGVAMAGLADGRSGLQDIASRLMRWNTSARWYALALLGPAAVWAVAVALHLALGAEQPAVHYVAWTTPLLIYAAKLFAGGGLGEELGWRGFALPRLEAVMSPLGASVVIGAAWGVWHAPAFFFGGAGKEGGLVLLALFTIYTCALSILFTVLYHKTGGSLLLTALLHAALNSTEDTLKTFLPGLRDAARPTFLYAGLLLAIAALLVAVYGRRLGMRKSDLSPDASEADAVAVANGNPVQSATTARTIERESG